MLRARAFVLFLSVAACGVEERSTTSSDLPNEPDPPAQRLETCTVLAETYQDPGSDGEWLTEDDVLSSAREDTLVNGYPVQVTFYLSAGDDGEWKTMDDTIVYAAIETDPSSPSLARRIVTSRDMGPDKLWGTADDSVDSITTWELDDSGRIQKKRFYYAGGETVTEELASLLMYVKFEYTDGRLGRRLQFASPGQDGQWMTDDDEPSHIQEYIFSGGTLTYARVLTSPVSSPANIIRYTFEGTALASIVYYSNAGEDAEWLTEDDVPGLATDYYRRSDGTLLREHTTYGNLIIDETFQYDELSRLTLVARASGAGADGLWGTDDDPLGRVFRYNYSCDTTMSIPDLNYEPKPY